MNDHGKPQNDKAQQGEQAHDLIVPLNLLEAVDRRITPEHVAMRFRELPNDIEDDGRDCDERAGMLAGERVRRAATGEDGVVLSAGDGVLVQVAFPSGTVWIHPEELEKLPEGRPSALPPVSSATRSRTGCGCSPSTLGTRIGTTR